jgi:hypothetical protein
LKSFWGCPFVASSALIEVIALFTFLVAVRVANLGGYTKKAMQDDQKVFIWILEIPTQPAPQKILFSTSGDDRQEAERKVVAYIEALPPTPSITPDLMRQWVAAVQPLVPEVKGGVWLLHLDTELGQSRKG